MYMSTASLKIKDSTYFHPANLMGNAFQWPNVPVEANRASLIQSLCLNLERPDSKYTAGICMVRAGAETLITLGDFFSLAEQNAWSKDAAAKRQQAVLWSRIAVKNALTAMAPDLVKTDFTVGTDIFGKPYIQNSAGLTFGVSISHTKDIAIAVVFPIQHPLALDVEAHSLTNSETIAGEMTAHESRYFENINLPNEMGYTLNWTIKEAYSKALSVGITTPMPILEVDSIEQTSPMYFESWLKNFTQFRIHSWVCGNYALTMTVPYKSTLTWKKAD
jgi:4'-phosphopantetheinyl transferase